MKRKKKKYDDDNKTKDVLEIAVMILKKDCYYYWILTCVNWVDLILLQETPDFEQSVISKVKKIEADQDKTKQEKMILTKI